MTAPKGRRGFDWEAAGRQVGERLDDYFSIVVIGPDPVTTGLVAVGLARTQAMRRRVALGDLFAESPPIQALVHTDDPHGIVDSFVYGVSLSRIAYQVPDAGQLFVMPSGSEPPAYEEILPHPRWQRLSAGFREVSALLVLAVPAGAPNVEDLVATADGAILVGEATPARLPAAKVIAAVREPRPEPVDQIFDAARARAPRRTGFKIAPLIGIALGVIIVVLSAWLAYRPLSRSRLPALRRGPAKALPTVIAPPADSTRPTATDTAVVDSAPAAPASIANPSDSLVAASFAVELMAANTQAGAILKLQQDGKTLPAATFAPVLVQGSEWFKVICGAYSRRVDADILLAGLRRIKVLEARTGGVVRLPFAFLIDSGVPAAAVPGMVATYAERGQPVYALVQSNGTAWLLAGAFESQDQSSLYAKSLRASGIQPVLVYRKGRPF